MSILDSLVTRNRESLEFSLGENRIHYRKLVESSPKDKNPEYRSCGVFEKSLVDIKGSQYQQRRAQA